MSDADWEFMAGGIARRFHLDAPVCQHVYKELAKSQESYSRIAWLPDRSAVRAYPLPKEPLFWWSRRWEYPFVAAHLIRLPLGSSVLDIGSAVTFFDRYLVGQEYAVECLDTNQNLKQFHDAACSRLGYYWPFHVLDAAETGLPSGSFDAVILLSVLEHMPRWAEVLLEAHRLLKPGGLLLLTLDIALDPRSNGFSLEDLKSMCASLSQIFEVLAGECPEDIPADALTNRDFPEPELEGEHLAVYGGVWQKK